MNVYRYSTKQKKEGSLRGISPLDYGSVKPQNPSARMRLTVLNPQAKLKAACNLKLIFWNSTLKTSEN
jgi:hypothetical protein